MIEHFEEQLEDGRRAEHIEEQVKDGSDGSGDHAGAHLVVIGGKRVEGFGHLGGVNVDYERGVNGDYAGVDEGLGHLEMIVVRECQD